MDKEELFNSLRTNLEKSLHSLQDKPEEDTDSTLKALWYKVAGYSVSSEKATILPIMNLTVSQIDHLHQLIRHRLNGIPLAHITERQNFMGIELKTDKRALIPRKETELLGKKAVELSLKMTEKGDMISVIDVGCGSGNLGLAIAKYNTNCVVYASDISVDAVNLAQENIDLLGLSGRVSVRQGDLLAAFETDVYYEKINLIVCNPPYISSAKVSKMDTEISANEPALAFDGGMLGTSIIQKLIREAPRFLTYTGCLVFEVGLGQGTFIMQLCERTQLYACIESFQDDASNIRVILARKNQVFS